jgi:hypothetical protein
LEELLTTSGWAFAIVEMCPAMEGRLLTEDPLSTRQALDGKRSADRTKRLAARSELSKLGIDASDRARLVRAIEAGDEDVVDLFVEAGAIDLASRDASGTALMDHTSSPTVRERLIAKR